jgi:ribosomal protein S18 acetylase RimI-like enzyme
MNPIFRTFQAEDLAELQQMMLALYQEDSYDQPMTPEKARRTAEMLTQHPQRGGILLFIVDNVIAGYAILINYWSNEYGGDLITIDELYVKPPWRSRGIGRRFFEYLSEQRPNYVTGMQLETSPANQRALAYYRTLGFEPSSHTFLMKLF